MLAPRPPATADACAPIIVAGSLHTPNGLGESARSCLRALETKGLEPCGIDLSHSLFQPGLLDFPFRDARFHRGPGVIILHVNAPLVPLACLSLGRSFLAEKKVIAYWAWELAKLPPEWRIAEQFIHEVWVPSRFTAEAVADLTRHPIRVVPHPSIKVNPAIDSERVWRRPSKCRFAVLTMFDMASSFARKNPLGAVAAFRLAFNGDPHCRLVIKMANGKVYPFGLKQLREVVAAEKNIDIIDYTLTPSQVTALYDECDVVLSMHRAEGFGLVAAEGMCRGKAVIATGWSGNMDFMTPYNSLPVSYRLVPAEDPQFTYNYPQTQWAEANVEQAARYLVRLSNNTSYARSIGQRAKADAEKLFDWKQYPNPLQAYDKARQ